MQSLEIAVFEARDPEAFVDRQVELHEQVGKVFDGYVTSLGLRSVSTPELFADLVLWDDEAAATAAAEAMPTTPELAWLHDELAAVRWFGHLDAAVDASDLLATIGGALVVELVLVRPVETDAFALAHRRLHAALEEVDGVSAHLRLLRNGDGVVGDVNGWRDEAAMAETGPAMAARSELAPVFDERNEMVLFEAFSANVVR